MNPFLSVSNMSEVDDKKIWMKNIIFSWRNLDFNFSKQDFFRKIEILLVFCKEILTKISDLCDFSKDLLTKRK